MKMEYANLSELKAKDLLTQGDKGQWLWLCIGLTEAQAKLKDGDKILDDYLDASFSQKCETHPELAKNLFENKQEIDYYLHFTMNRFHYPRFKENHQLDEELCKKYVDKLIDSIERLETTQKKNNENLDNSNNQNSNKNTNKRRL